MIEQLKEDIEQYQKAMEDFYNLMPEAIDGAYQLAMVFMQIANRWTEIQLNSDKLCSELEVTKTRFRDYAYQKHRMAERCHEFCRVVWKQSKEDMRNSFHKEEI